MLIANITPATNTQPNPSLYNGIYEKTVETKPNSNNSSNAYTTLITNVEYIHIL